MSAPLFSIVTVCYNAEDTIRETILSVVNQTCDDYEYLIVDGQSVDGTMRLIEQYKYDPHLSVISEKDSGLYDAMNKATRLVKGQFVLFLNSGDCLVSNDVLEQLKNLNNIRNLKEADLIYGNVIRRMPKGNIREKYGERSSIKRRLLVGKMISHQVMFVKSEVMKKYEYDESFRITADFNLLAKIIRDKCKLEYVDLDISIVENREGISEIPENLEIMRTEDDRTIKECFPIWYQILRPVKWIVRRRIKRQ